MHARTWIVIVAAAGSAMARADGIIKDSMQKDAGWTTWDSKVWFSDRGMSAFGVVTRDFKEFPTQFEAAVTIDASKSVIWGFGVAGSFCTRDRLHRHRHHRQHQSGSRRDVRPLGERLHRRYGADRCRRHRVDRWRACHRDQRARRCRVRHHRQERRRQDGVQPQVRRHADRDRLVRRRGHVLPRFDSRLARPSPGGRHHRRRR